MTIQPGSANYSLSYGISPENVQIPHVDVRAPAITDVNYPLGKTWIDRTGNASYILTSVSSNAGKLSANWQPTGGSSEILETLTGDTGTAVPSGGNIKISGTANQLTTSASGSTVTLSFPSNVILPGSITSGGNVDLGAPGNKVTFTVGVNASIGSGTLSGGAATFLNTSVTSNSLIFLTHGAASGTLGILSVGTVIAGTSFGVVSSSASDNSTVNYWIIN